MGRHDTPSVLLGKLDGVDTLTNGADLVNLEQQTVGRLGINGLTDFGRIGHGQVISDDLDFFTDGFRNPGGQEKEC